MKIFKSASGFLLGSVMLIIMLEGCKKEKGDTTSFGPRAAATVTTPNKVTVSTYAGCNQGYQDGPALTARFNWIGQLVEGPDSVLYVADYNVIRKISRDGTVSTLAGCYTSTTSRDGIGQQGWFTHIVSLTITPWRTLFAYDLAHFTDRFSPATGLRQITPDGTVTEVETDFKDVERFAQGPVAFGPDSLLYVLTGNGFTRVGPVPTKNTDFFYGPEPNRILVYYPYLSSSYLSVPATVKSIAAGKDGSIYLMTTDNQIYKRSLQDIIKNYPAGGLGLSKTLAKSLAVQTVKPDTSSIYRDALAIAADGTVYFTDGVVIKMLHTDGSVSVLAGSTPGYVDGPANKAKFKNITSLELAYNDTVLFVADSYIIRKITLK